MITKLITEDKQKLWLAAIKPPMYSVAVMPIILGTAVSFAQTHIFDAQVFFTFLGAAISILAWLNLSNDYFDSETGIDVNKAHSVVNLTGNKSLVFWTSNLCLALGISGIIAISWWQQDWMVLALVSLCCALGYSYQGPPFRFGYLGLGEIICFITFGPLAIAAAYYSQSQTFSLQGLATSVIIGITTSIILFCSHFHQEKDDLAAGKKSPIVRLGTYRGSQVLTWSVCSVFIFSAIFVIINIFPQWTLLIFLSLPFAYQLISYVQQYHNQPEKVSSSKFIAINLHFFSSLLLALGFILSTH